MIRLFPVFSKLLNGLLLALFGLVLLNARGADIEIRGLAPEQEQLLFKQLRPRFEFILSRPATPFRAADAAYLLERQLVRRGYFEARVTPRVLQKQNRILLEAETGQQFFIGEVKLNGVDDEDKKYREKLIRYFFQAVIEREQVPREQAPYTEGYGNEGAANIVTYLNSKGFWGAKCEVDERQIDRREGVVNFTLRVQPGPEHKLTSPTLVLAEPIESTELVEDLAAYADRVATSEHINEVRKLVGDFIETRGYNFAQFTINADHSVPGLTQLTINLIPGGAYRIGNSLVEGLVETRESRFLRQFNKLRGKEFDQSLINRRTDRLLSTGAFNSIRTDPVLDKADDEVLNLKIEVTEADARGYRFYGGFGTFEGPILGAGYFNRNFLNRLYNYNVRTEFSMLGPLGELSVADPFFAGEDITFAARMFILRRNYEEYAVEQAGAGLSWLIDFSPQQQLNVFTEATLVNIRPDGLEPIDVGQDYYLAKRVGVEHTLDLRDDPAAPTSGFRSIARAELVNILGESDNTNFGKARLAFSYYQPIGENYILAAGLKTGTIIPIGDRRAIPIDERFFIGGPDSVRSFRWRDFGPRPLSGNLNRSVGGEAFWSASGEIQRRIAGPLWVTAFSDVGAISRNYDRLPEADTSFAAGLGIQIKLPVGPVRIEYAHNLNQGTREPSGTWLFAIGTAF